MRKKLNLTEKVKALCEQKGCSMRQVEMKCRIASGAICRWSEHPPSIDRAKRVADFLGVTLDELMKE